MKESKKFKHLKTYNMGKVEMGNEVTDMASGFKGTVVAELLWISGCKQWGVKPAVNKAGEQKDTLFIDNDLLEVTGPGISVKLAKKKSELGTSAVPGGSNSKISRPVPGKSGYSK